jgi:hypothetical protein
MGDAGRRSPETTRMSLDDFGVLQGLAGRGRLGRDGDPAHSMRARHGP